ncbi:MAG: beta-lactamase family protein [Acidobacteria bacterium]|jgi:CubicO group peptidase (beta-lactamase class C family)|nr:beta-lactamase family protein [Acidobacteriota bacterium]
MTHRFPVFTLLALLLATPALSAEGLPTAATPESVGLSSDRLERLRTVMQEYADQGRVAGVVTYVARNGRVAHLEAAGMADIEAGREMSTDSVFRIASQTKAVTSVAAMMLVEEGRIGLADPVARYLPAFEKTTVAVPGDGSSVKVVPAARAITIHDLLTHTAGISYGEGPARDRWKAAGIQGWYFADRDEPVSAVVERMASLPMDAQPGERFVYGYNSDILGVVVEKVSGMTLAEFFAKRITGPLGLEDTMFYLPPAQKDRLAAVYAAKDGGIVRATDPRLGQGHYVEGPRVAFSGGAGLLSTARDYGRFLQALLDGGELGGVRLLSPKTIELMTVNHVGPRLAEAWDDRHGMGFGLGFDVVVDLGEYARHGSLGAWGWGGAYHTTYWADPKEDLVALLMTQLLPAGDSDIQRTFRALVYQAIVGPPGGNQGEQR